MKRKHLASGGSSRYWSGKISAYRTAMKLIWACRDFIKVLESDYKIATTPQNHRFLETRNVSGLDSEVDIFLQWIC